MPCAVEGCPKAARARGWCPAHYQQWRKYGSPTGAPVRTIEGRFWAKVDKNGPLLVPALGPCWVWTGSTHKFGHGEFFVSRDRGRTSSHAYSLEMASGVRRPPGLDCCHHCDNPPCVRPDHLYYGTRQQNVDDAIARGRHAEGARNGQSRLTAEQVVEIRTRFSAGETSTRLAREFSVTDGAISVIVNGRRWSSAGGPISPPSRGRRTEAARRQFAVDPSALPPPLRGQDIGGARLSEDDVRELRHLRAQGATLSALALRFGVSEGAAQSCAARRTWKHVA